MEGNTSGEIKKSDKEFLAKEVTSSPKEFIDRFLESELFLKGKHGDVKGGPELRGLEDYKKELANRDVRESEEEIRRVFCGMGDAKLLLLHFAKRELMLKYDESKFDNMVNGAIDGYQAIVKKINSPVTKLNLRPVLKDLGGETMREMDSERQFRHFKVINALIDGKYVSSESMARAMARIMLISIGDDTFERVQSDEELRFRRLAEAAKFGHQI